MLAEVPVAALIRHMQSDAGYTCLLSSFMGLAVGLLPEQCRPLLHESDEGGRCERGGGGAGGAEAEAASAAEVVAAAAVAACVGREAADVSGGGAWDTGRVREIMRAALDAPLAAALCLESLCRRQPRGGDTDGDTGQAEAMDVGDGGAGASDGERWELEEAVVSELGPSLLQQRCERRLQVLFRKWWASLPLAARGALLPTLMGALRGGADGKADDATTRAVAPVASRAEVQCAPLSLLACSPRVWRTPPLAALILDELATAMGSLRRRVLHSQVSPVVRLNQPELSPELFNA